MRVKTKKNCIFTAKTMERKWLERVYNYLVFLFYKSSELCVILIIYSPGGMYSLLNTFNNHLLNGLLLLLVFANNHSLYHLSNSHGQLRNVSRTNICLAVVHRTPTLVKQTTNGCWLLFIELLHIINVRCRYLKLISIFKERAESVSDFVSWLHTWPRLLLVSHISPPDCMCMCSD